MRKYVSIIIPVYQTPHYFVETAIRSALFQTGNIETEVILVDDASTNSWWENIDQSLLEDDRVTLHLLPKNCGAGYAWDYGIKKAKYDWITPLAADDYIHPDKSEIQFAIMNEAKKQASLSGFRTYTYKDNRIIKINNHTPPTYKDNKKQFEALRRNDYETCFIKSSTTLFKKELYEKLGGFDYNLRYAQGHDLWLRMANETLIIDVPLQLLTRREYDNQIANLFQNDKEKNYERIRTIEYAKIKLKWEKLLTPITNRKVNMDILKEEGYL